ncbi:MAG TPA: PilZ domain-containing protein [Candidatus Angelobacter sp.]|nr:PilZ domain-containing protein [Candidatus Angelobacter sp.]
MPSRSILERRRSKRTPLKKRASLIVKRGQHAQRVPCLLLDNSQDGFKIGGASRLKRGQYVELILDEHTSNTVPCRVTWVGKPGSKQGGEAGLQIKISSS